MNEMEKLEKGLEGALAALWGALMARLGIFAPWFGVLLAAMLTDYCTGMVSAAYRGELSSRIGLRGILKKLGCWLMVAAALITDWAVTQGSAALGFTLATGGAAALTTVCWLILNEVISILENLGKMDVALPGFLTGMVKSLSHQLGSGNKEKGEEQQWPI